MTQPTCTLTRLDLTTHPNFTNYMRAALIQALLRLLARLPLRVVHSLGNTLGILFWRFPTRLKQVTITNISSCFPQLNAIAQQHLAQSNLKETGKALLEVGPMWCWNKDRLLKMIDKISGEDAVRHGREQGRGVIFAGPHLGSWELTGMYLAEHYAATMMYRPPRLLALEPIILAARERFGAHMVQTSAAGVRGLFHVLQKGGCVGILPDQDPGDGSGVFAPFFGNPAYTMTLLSRLARKTGAAVFFVYAQRHARGHGYQLHFVAAHPDIAHPNPNIATHHLNAGIEACVRALPDQYQWGYKRFKTRPKDARDFYSPRR